MSKTPSKAAKLIQPADVSRVQAAVARQHQGQVPKGSYVGRMQRTVAVVPTAKKADK